MLIVETIPLLSDNYSYLLHEPETQTTAVVDPAAAEPVLEKLAHRHWRLNYVLNTHHHPDHVGGNLLLKARTGCQILAPELERERIPGVDQGLKNGDQLALGSLALTIMETHGHTNGHIVFYCAASGDLFCGDSLFVLGCGRLFEGNATQLWQSLQKLKTLPPTTRVYCAHEYSFNNALFALMVEPDNTALQQRMLEIKHQRSLNQPTVPTTIAEELATNPFFREDSHSLQTTLKCQGLSAIEIIARLRGLKDDFQPFSVLKSQP
jgi:hydroxyacylglutathione hydrolase